MATTVGHPRELEFGSDRDRRMQAAAVEALSLSSYAALRRLNCRVLGGVVEISGSVSSFYLKQLAQAAILRVQPCGAVRNLVEVRDRSPTG